jgi:hypothetical protein
MRWQKRQLHHNNCAAGAVSALLRNFSNTLLEMILVAAMRESGIASFLCGAEFWTRWDVKRTCCNHFASLEIERSAG